ncbi:hypothetical protein ES703_70400 [subsurface metagenome]
MLLWPLLSPSYKHSYHRRCGIKHGHAVILYYFPYSASVRVVRGSFIEYLGGTYRQRTINIVGVACNPTNVRSAPKYILIVEVKIPLCCPIGLSHITTGGVDNSLWLACSATGIKNI